MTSKQSVKQRDLFLYLTKNRSVQTITIKDNKQNNLSLCKKDVRKDTMKVYIKNFSLLWFHLILLLHNELFSSQSQLLLPSYNLYSVAAPYRPQTSFNIYLFTTVDNHQSSHAVIYSHFCLKITSLVTFIFENCKDRHKISFIFCLTTVSVHSFPSGSAMYLLTWSCSAVRMHQHCHSPLNTNDQFTLFLET